MCFRVPFIERRLFFGKFATQIVDESKGRMYNIPSERYQREQLHKDVNVMLTGSKYCKCSARTSSAAFRLSGHLFLDLKDGFESIVVVLIIPYGHQPLEALVLETMQNWCPRPSELEASPGISYPYWLQNPLALQ